MEYFTQQLVNGVTLGSIYGLIAIGYTMVYGVLQLINFAHSEVFIVGAYALFFTLAALGFGPSEPDLSPIALVADLILAMLVAMVGFVSTVAYCRFLLRGDIIE